MHLYAFLHLVLFLLLSSVLRGMYLLLSSVHRAMYLFLRFVSFITISVRDSAVLKNKRMCPKESSGLFLTCG
jgi:hypothetical protein